MLCDICRKKRATSHYSRTINGVKQEFYLCPECASELARQYSDGMGLTGLLGNYSLGIDSILNSMLENGFGNLIKKSERASGCPLCGTTFAEIKQTGMAGCPQCYEVFRRELIPIVERIHGKAVHSGKIPASVSSNNQETEKAEETILELERELSEAVEAQNFEQAAVIRDKLKMLRKEGSK